MICSRCRVKKKDDDERARSIISLACEVFVIEKDLLLGLIQKQYIVDFRQATMYCVRFHTGLSFPQIARLFSSRDHTTVIHACRKAEDNFRVAELVEELLEEIESSGCLNPVYS